MHNSNAEVTRQVSPRKAAQYWRATLERDARADGTFVLAVRSTHIYCRPSCPARRPLRRNVIFFRTREEAEKQGYRACLRCRPNETAASAALVARASKILAQSHEEGVRLSELARELHSNAGTLRRAFRQVTGLAPRELAEALRVKRFKNLLRAGKNITDALYETGYGSSSRVYERKQRATGNDTCNLSKGRKRHENGIHDCEVTTWKGSCRRHGTRVSAVYLGDAQNKLVEELREEYPHAEMRLPPAACGWVHEIVQRMEGNPRRWSSC
jgi:AraC family transcriptional regulator of adaptative response/methylated-DNA-[protein]-cysteine methyltransferase